VRGQPGFATPDARKFCTGSGALCKECIAEALFCGNIEVKGIGTTIAFSMNVRGSWWAE
jgi:hypothetical protein